MEKSNLDNLFKEKFKDFSEIPDEKVWENIEASLDKKKKKRIVPIWWQLGGAAAAIALLLYLVNPFSTNENVQEPNVVNTENNVPSNSEVDTENRNADSKIFQEPQNNQVVGTATSDSSQNTNNEEKDEFTSKDSNVRDVLNPKSNALEQEEVVLAETQNQQTANKRQTAVPEERDPNNIVVGENTAVIANSEGQKDTPIDESNANPRDNLEAKSEVAVTENKESEDGTISIFDAIEEQKNQEDEAIADNTQKRWSMGPSVAPVFFGSVGEGSPIHSNFASNSKSGNLNLSYGLQVTYNISKKLSIRSGVHRVDYGYDTNDVVFTSSLTTSTNELIDNITYAQTSRNLVVESKNNEVAALSDNSFAGGTAQPFEGRMVQQLGYVEVPMELNYALLDKKFGINLIGGVSSLFLVDNAVSLESEQLITEMGEANNANDINFSTNIGVGFNYEISQKLQLNVEPIFKYQLNTFSETAGNFRPYSVGVYSGLSFKF